MALSALIAAMAPARDGGGLRATLPLAGHALIEHQARQAAAAGADRLVILADRVPAALAGALDRLRRNGIAVDLARSPADAADRFHPQERVLVFADGLIADQALIDRAAAAPLPAVFALPDTPPFDGFERIDGARRWAGIMVLDGARIHETAAMLGEWDMVLTLLRLSLQAGAPQLPAVAADADGAQGPHLVDGTTAMEGARRRLLAATIGTRRAWTARFLFAPIEDRLAPPLVRRGVDPYALRSVAVALLLLAAVGFAFGLPGWALALALISGPVDALATRIARMRLQPFRRHGPATMLRALAWTAALAGLCAGLARDQGLQAGGWAYPALGIAAGLFMLALSTEKRLLRLHQGPAAVRPAWLADPDALAWTLLPLGIAGWWVAGPAVLAGYAAASFFRVQRAALAALRPAPPPARGTV